MYTRTIDPRNPSETVHEGEEPQTAGEIITTLQAAFYLLEHTQLAQLYSYVVREGPVDVATIQKALDIPSSTAYARVEELEELGVLAPTGDTQPVTYDAEWLAVPVETSDGELAHVSTPLIAVVGRRSLDEDIDLFLDRHDLGKLAEAVQQTRRIRGGEVTQRMAADELGVPAVEGMTIFAAIQDTLDTFDRQSGADS